MARDPEVQHDTHQLCAGLQRVGAGDDLADSPDLRVELDYLGFVRVNHFSALEVTRDGRQFLDANT